MFSKFMNLDNEKRMRIINAGMKEFAIRGFDGGKTDNIVKEAGISKGLLFHYFGTKKAFFLFLVDYALEICINDYLPKINMDKDIFIRLRQNTIIKKDLLLENPFLFNFLLSVVEKGLGSLKDEIGSEIFAKIEQFRSEAYDRLFNGLDLSKFRADVDPEKGLEMIMWVIEGYQKKYMAEHGGIRVEDLDYDQFVQELDEYFCLLRESLYKK